MDIAVRVFELADLPIDIVYQSIDDVGMDDYLLEIASCLYEGISSIKPYCPIAGGSETTCKVALLKPSISWCFSIPPA
jgi:hypothetical protein